MSNIKLLKTNFKSLLKEIKIELSPYINVLHDYEKHLDFSEYPNRVSIVYPFGNTQKSLYANRALDKKKPLYKEFDNYKSLQLFYPRHSTLNHTLELKSGDFSEDIVTEIKNNIFKETGCDLSNCEAAIATKYENYTLQPHIDGGQQESGVTNRIHLVLESSETSYFEDKDNIRYNPKEGEIWDLDVTQTHAAGNHSPQRVTHLVLDYKG
jgi:hypothetical protein